MNKEKTELKVSEKCACGGALDEAPMAYKPMEEILNNIGDTVEVLGVIKPVYNFKAGE